MMKIEVTQDDIVSGKHGIARLCPVALAMRRAGFHNPIVGEDEIVADGRTWKTPAFVSEFVQDFDGGETVVEPFTFELPD